MSLKLIFSFFSVTFLLRAADLIPPANIVDWTPGTYTGVTGGIPTRPSGSGTTIDVTLAPYFADNTGATDASGAIQSAINASTAESVIYLPAGTYRCDSSINILQSASITNRVIRGAGMDVTFIKPRTAVAMNIGATDNTGAPSGYTLADITVSSGLTYGSTQLTVGNSNGYTVGAMLIIQSKNDDAVPMVSVYQQNWMMLAIRKITGKPTGTTVTFSPPLTATLGGGAFTAYAATGENGSQAYGIGVESMTIDFSDYGGSSSSAIVAQQARDSWVKDVKFIGVIGYPISTLLCYNFEVRGCYMGQMPPGSNRAGFLMTAGSGILFENNIIYACMPAIEINSGASGNFFSRNFAIGQAFGFDINHSPGNTLNLYEGNYLNEIISDGYFGGSTYDTLFRNYVISAVSLKRFTRNTGTSLNFFAQQIQSGYPNIGNTGYTGTADYPSSPGLDFATGYGFAGTLTTRTGDNNGTITISGGSVGSIVPNRTIQVSWDTGRSIQKYMNVVSVAGTVLTVEPPCCGISAGPAFPTAGTSITLGAGVEGFQELDGGVARTLSKTGNRYLDDNSFDSLGGATPVDSLVYGSTKPQWLLDEEIALGRTFNLAAWDPVTPVTPASQRAAAELIPAGWRYYNPDGSVTTANVTNLNVGTIRLSP